MKKEFYLDSKNHLMKISQWKNELSKISRYSKFNFSTTKSALLVLDMQEIFLNPESHAFIETGKSIVSNIIPIIDFYSRNDLKIIYTKHITENSKYDLMHKWWRNPIIRDSKEANIISALNTNNGVLMEKFQYSAFYQTSLTQYLHDNNITQLVISGLMTHLCCETTARDAFMRGFEIFFLMDGCATYNEELHISSLKAIRHGFGEVVSFQDLFPNLSNEV